MSISSWSTRTRALHPVNTLPRPRLTVVSKAGPQAARLPFLLFVMALLVSGLIGLLLLNTALQRGAYTATELRQTYAALDVRRELLETKVGALQDPQRVVQQADQLGMVRNDSPAFLSLANGSVIGKPIAASATNPVILNQGTSSTGGGGKVAGPVAGAGSSLAATPVIVAKPPRPQASAQTHTNKGEPRG